MKRRLTARPFWSRCRHVSFQLGPGLTLIGKDRRLPPLTLATWIPRSAPYFSGRCPWPSILCMKICHRSEMKGRCRVTPTRSWLRSLGFHLRPYRVAGIPYSARNVAQPILAARGGFSENLQLSRNRTDLLDRPKCIAVYGRSLGSTLLEIQDTMDEVKLIRLIILEQSQFSLDWCRDGPQTSSRTSPCQGWAIYRRAKKQLYDCCGRQLCSQIVV